MKVLRALARHAILSALALSSVVVTACGDGEPEELVCQWTLVVAEGFETVFVTFDVDELEDAIDDRPELEAQLGFADVTTCEQAGAAWQAIHPFETPPITET
jgi:hypothetical protein